MNTSSPPLIESLYLWMYKEEDRNTPYSPIPCPSATFYKDFSISVGDSMPYMF